MAMQLCPKCRADAFTWAVHDEDELAEWWCRGCDYRAKEDESKETTCPHCGQQQASLLLHDDDGFHRWCFCCHRFEPTTENFYDGG